MGCGASSASSTGSAPDTVTQEGSFRVNAAENNEQPSPTSVFKKKGAPKTVLVDEVDESGIQDESVPSYWTNKKHADKALFSQMVYVNQDHHEVFNELLKASYEAKSTKDRPCPKKVDPCDRQSQGCPCVRVDGDPGLPTGFCVRRIVRVEHANSWARYAKKRKEIYDKRNGESMYQFKPPLMTAGVAQSPEVFDVAFPSINEGYLWHGTSIRTALSIAQLDFDMSKAGTGRGAMYGPGAYFGESCTKADEYAFDEPGGYYDGIRAMLLCRVCMGKMYYTTKFGQEEAYDKVKDGSFDSVLADLARYRKTFREFVVYDADQIYPEYVILYQRVFKADNAEQIREIAATPFHLELPIYWRNCHRVPKAEEFDEQCQLKTTSMELLQQLVTACSNTEVNVRGARRIENSKLLNQYVAFKAKVRAYLTGDALQPALSKSNRCLSCSSIDESGGSVRTAKFLAEAGTFVEESVSVDNLDLPLNEHWLWYGASKDEVRAMAHMGLDIDRGGNNPDFLRYGRGLYFSDVLDQVINYCEEDADGKKHLLLCRVCCGEMLYTEEESLPTGDEKAIEEKKHSVFANPTKGGPREFIVLESAQVYPEFVMEVTWW